MALDTTRPRSRRSLITAAAGAAAAATVATLGKPLAAAAADGDPLVLGTDNIATARTNLDGDLAMTGTVDIVGNVVATNMADPEDIGAGFQIPLRGIAGDGTAVVGSTQGGSLRPAGVVGHCAGEMGYGVSAYNSAQGTGLYVHGKAQFATRSGRAKVLAGRSSVDIDLRTKGGLSGTPLCFANLTSYRPGVYVAAVRPNYPSAGKARIYLSRTVTADTFVAWFVLN